MIFFQTIYRIENDLMLLCKFQISDKLQITKLILLDDHYMNRLRNSKWPLVENTSTFDIAMCVILCRMLDDELFYEKVLQNVNASLRKFMEIYLKNGSSQETYLARNEVLNRIFKTETINEMKVMNCESDFLEVIEKAFESSIAIIGNTSGHIENAKLSEICFLNNQEKKLSYSEVPQILVVGDKLLILYAIIEQKHKVFVAHIKSGTHLKKISFLRAISRTN